MKVDHASLIGLHCPHCGEPLNSRLVAKSYPMHGGHYRKRYCSCGTDVVSFERVVASDPKSDVRITVISVPARGNNTSSRGRGAGSDLSLVLSLVRRLGGKVTKI